MQELDILCAYQNEDKAGRFFNLEYEDTNNENVGISRGFRRYTDAYYELRGEENADRVIKHLHNSYKLNKKSDKANVKMVETIA